MRRRQLMGIVLMVLLLAGVQGARADMKFLVGETISTGLWSIWDVYKDNIEAEDPALEVQDPWSSFAGVLFTTYYEFNHGSRVGGDVGPLSLVWIIELNGDGNWYYFALPLGVHYGFTILPRFNISPYFRVGVKYHIALGDYVNNSIPGPYGVIGVEFLRRRVVGFGFEIGYDGSQVELEEIGPTRLTMFGPVTTKDEKTVTCGGILAAGYARF